MKFLKIILPAAAAILVLLAVGCQEEKCLHQNMVTDTRSASCEISGKTVHTCPDCGFSYTDEIKEPTGHIFTSVTTEPTCTRGGYTEYICDCGYTYLSNFLSAHGHEFVDTVSDTVCGQADVTHRECSVCEYSYTITDGEPVAHSLVKKTVLPTCTEQGYTEYSCENCEYSYSSEYNAPEGHEYSRLVTMPTLSDMGYTNFKCTKCEHEYTGELRFYSDILPNAYSGSETVLAHGIDVSYHNYKTDGEGNYIPLDWQRIKESGVDYVIIRAGYSAQADGSFNVDKTFEMSYEGARAAGLDVGAYFYTNARSVADIEFEAYMLRKLLQGKKFEYPIYLDLEDPSYLTEDKLSLASLTPADITQMCITFFTIMQRSGYYTGLYINESWLQNFIYTDIATSKFEIWYARHPSGDGEFKWDSSKDGEALGMWQYSSTGVIEGIDVHFDLNYSYKDYPTLIKNGGFNGYDSDVVFPSTGKTFAVIYANILSVRSSPDFTADNVIGYVKKNQQLEVIERTDEYTKVYYKGETAYISAKPEYVQFLEM